MYWYLFRNNAAAIEKNDTTYLQFYSTTKKSAAVVESGAFICIM